MSYTGDLSDPGEKLYTLDYYLKLAEQIVDAGAHVLAIKDMAGLLRVPAAQRLVGALRSRFDLPVHVHTHDTPGGQLATYVAAWHAGADAVDGAAAPLAGTTSQPALSSIVAAAAHTEYDTGLSLSAVCDAGAVLGGVAKGLCALRIRATRRRRAGCITTRFRAANCPICASRPSRLGWETDSRRSRTDYAAADRVLGRLVKVTPTSKVVGDLALALVGAGLSADEFASEPARFDIPESVHGVPAGRAG